MEIAYVISQANAQFVTFLLLSIFYLGALFISASFRNLVNQSPPLGIFISSPILIFEFIWLFHDSYAKRLVEEHGKLLKYRYRRNVP